MSLLPIAILYVPAAKPEDWVNVAQSRGVGSDIDVKLSPCIRWRGSVASRTFPRFTKLAEANSLSLPHFDEMKLDAKALVVGLMAQANPLRIPPLKRVAAPLVQVNLDPSNLNASLQGQTGKGQVCWFTTGVFQSYSSLGVQRSGCAAAKAEWAAHAASTPSRRGMSLMSASQRRAL